MQCVSAEMSANVSVLRDFLLFGDNPDLCSDLFNMRVLLWVYALADLLMLC